MTTDEQFAIDAAEHDGQGWVVPSGPRSPIAWATIISLEEQGLVRWRGELYELTPAGFAQTTKGRDLLKR